MKKSNRFILFVHALVFLLSMGLVLVCGTAMGQDKDDEKEFTLEDVVVTSTFRETDLQETPISITAVSGDMLEDQNILSVEDLGLIIPNADIRQTYSNYGPNAQIGLRGVGQFEFIPAFEPGVGVYVDDIYHGTLSGSTLDLLDLERVEVLRGPQGTLFGKNSLGGAIRMISKLPQGNNVGHLQVTYGEYDRLDFSGAYDFALIKDLAFVRISASSKKIDGYYDRLDFTCQMIANGTPELAGSFPSSLLSHAIRMGNCKIGEKGGKQSNAAKIMFRFTPTDKLEFNLSADYHKSVDDPTAETLLKGTDPNPYDPFGFPTTDAIVQWNIIDPTWNIKPGDEFTILGDTFVTDNYYTGYDTFEDPIKLTRWPDKQTQEFFNWSATVDYDIKDNIHLKGIFGYREYDTDWANSYGEPFSFNTTYNKQNHDQTSYEVRVNGSSFNERLDWTVGGYYFESTDYLGGYVDFGTYGMSSGDIYQPTGFDQNDLFTDESKSAFAHFVFAITEDLSLTAGGRYTDESKTYKFDHTGYQTVEEPLIYGGSHEDWKLSLDYKFTQDIMAYVMASTGFRSEGANPRPFFPTQLTEVSGEEIIAYEIGTKADFFDKRLRVNLSAFQNDYDPRLDSQIGAQCSSPTDFSDEPIYIVPFFSATCPEGSYIYNHPSEAVYGIYGNLAFVYFSAPGTSRGVELDLTARPIKDLAINASFGYFNYRTDVAEGAPGYIHPDQKRQAEFTYNIGAQYTFNFDNESMLIPRIDMFYQGERTNNGIASQPIAPYHIVPDYTVFNARLTYMPSDVQWSLSLEVKNLFDKFYWINIAPERGDNGTDIVYRRTGQPSPPRMIAVTFRRNFF